MNRGLPSDEPKSQLARDTGGLHPELRRAFRDDPPSSLTEPAGESGGRAGPYPGCPLAVPNNHTCPT